MRPLRLPTIAVILAVTASAAAAHRPWLLPSGTGFSGEDAWVWVDAAVSNDLFDADHVPLNPAQIRVTQADGAPAPSSMPRACAIARCSTCA